MAALAPPYRIRPDEQNPGAWVLERETEIAQGVLNGIKGPVPPVTPSVWEACDWFRNTTAAIEDVNATKAEAQAILDACTEMLAVLASKSEAP